MNQQSKIIQLIGDLSIPLLGYYFWDWNIYFILFFYILDVLISTVFTFVKTYKINQYQQTKQWPWIHIGLILLGSVLFKRNVLKALFSGALHMPEPVWHGLAQRAP